MQRYTRAATDHLPELHLGSNELEEDEIDDLRHVYAGIQHIDGKGNVGRLVLGGEVIDQTLRVFGFESDDAGELSLEMRIVRVEAIGDEVGMVLVLGEQNRLAEPVAACNGKTSCHQML